MTEVSATVQDKHAEAPLKASGLDHVVLHVADLDRSKQFYVDLLGLEVHREVREASGTKEEEFDAGVRCFLRCGDQQVGLFERSEGVGGDEVNHLALRLETGDRESIRRVLEQAGIEVRGRSGDPGCLYLSDPDGHRIQLLPPGEH